MPNAETGGCDRRGNGDDADKSGRAESFQVVEMHPAADTSLAASDSRTRRHSPIQKMCFRLSSCRSSWRPVEVTKEATLARQTPPTTGFFVAIPGSRAFRCQEACISAAGSAALSSGILSAITIPPATFALTVGVSCSSTVSSVPERRTENSICRRRGRPYLPEWNCSKRFRRRSGS